jgi:hypothetical protein
LESKFREKEDAHPLISFIFNITGKINGCKPSHLEIQRENFFHMVKRFLYKHLKKEKKVPIFEKTSQSPPIQSKKTTV